MPPVLYQCLSACLLWHTLVERTVCLLCTRHCAWVEGDSKMYNKGSCSQESYHSVRGVVLNQGQFCPPQGTFGNIWWCFWLSWQQMCGAGTGIQEVETRDAENILQCPGQPLHPPQTGTELIALLLRNPVLGAWLIRTEKMPGFVGGAQMWTVALY